MLMRLNRSKWLVPGFAVAMGLVFLAVQWANDDPGGGLVSLAIMVGFAAALVAFSSRSAVFEVMRNPQADERSSMLDLRATAFAGLVVILALIVAFVWDLAHGYDPSPYSQLGALAGAAYLVALIALQRRS
jgi:Na+/H+ antiporter NhaD/arsenite permease-like protein